MQIIFILVRYVIAQYSCIISTSYEEIKKYSISLESGMAVEITTRVKNVLSIIESKEFTQKELVVFFKNVVNDTRVSEEEREIIIEALSIKIKANAPRLAKKMFGPKDTAGREFLQTIYDIFEQVGGYDFSQNCVGKGVKTGGDMISGKAYVDLYFSYKNKDKWHAGISYNQKTAKDEPKFIVKIYQGGESNLVGKEWNEFDMADEEKAVMLFKGYLDRIII